MKLHFMKYRKLSYWISGFCILLSILSIFFKGFNYGIDFSGGISMEVVPTSQEYTIDKMRHELAAFKPELQAIDGNAILLRVGLPKGSTDEQQNERVSAIKAILGDHVTYSINPWWCIGYTCIIYHDGCFYLDSLSRCICGWVFRIFGF